jgi:hypothetical protein
MNTLRLPSRLDDARQAARINADLRARRVSLDWRDVRDATDEALAALLEAVDLLADADVLGLDAMEGVPDAVMETVDRLLPDRGPDAAPATAPTPSEGESPSIWRSGEERAKPRKTPRRQSTGRPEKILVSPTPAALRAEFEDMVVRDLLGPAGGPEEEVDEGSVRSRYVLGLLAPLQQRVAPEEDEDYAAEDQGSGEDGTTDSNAVQGASMFPSSFGVTFSVAGSAPGFRVTASWGWYQKRPSEFATEEDGRPKRVWKRTPVEVTSPTMNLVEGPIAPWAVTARQPDVKVKGLIRRHGEEWIVTLFLVNEQQEPDKNRDEAWLFQAALTVEAPEDAPDPCIFVRRPSLPRDPVTWAEEHALEMLYRHQGEFATGHGVAVHVDPAPGRSHCALRIGTRVVPAWEVAQQTAPTDAEEPLLADLTLDMAVLASLPPKDLAARLGPLPDAYGAWIARQRARLDDPSAGLDPYRDAVLTALDRCEAALRRIREGITLLLEDPSAARAFAFANRAMALQRVRTLFTEETRRGGEPKLDELDVPPNRSWRLFQLAFILLNLPGLTRLDHPDRTREHDATADLLWFPTGGGKTEAYLGLTAYTLALRRLQGTIEGRSGEHGVAVLMRYTLRLLTLQQCQRATALICACETIRREDDKLWGREPFRIGLWVGERTTPNKTADADEWLKRSHGQFNRGAALAGIGSPQQLTNCPWCGRVIDAGKHLKVSTFERGSGRTLVFCGDPYGRCPFSERQSPGEGIPIVVVDEEIYRLLPSLLISTVDKFALMPWKGTTQTLFGQVAGRCERHGFRSPDLDDADSHPAKGGLKAAATVPFNPVRPPDLIIQDELHLIAGPLGTLTGLYETAVDQLASWEVAGQRVRPKVIASTATTRRARDQVHALFLREVAVFPPHGLDVGDNFFARHREPSEKVPGRRYLGICAPGRRLKAVLIRVYVACLAAAQRLFDLYGRAADPWMTLVGYFNAMRELAGMRRLLDDDVRSRLRDTDQRGLARRSTLFAEELTSRKSSTDIPALLDRLEITFEPAEPKVKGAKPSDRPRPLDALLATNMISVGVDVRRLGLMVVAGQPKNTAEYIQATSRVGRSWPGIVFAVYNWARPRDLSHYECFEHYHATFYKQVEALSVTPFAPRALDRGLSGVFVALVRLAGLDLNPNEKAEAITRQHPLVARAIERIVARAKLVSGSQAVGDEVERQLKRRLDTWLREATRNAGGSDLGYREKRDGKTRGLLTSPGVGAWEDFTCLWSLRDVEPTVNLVLDDGRLDDDPVVSTEVSA